MGRSLRLGYGGNFGTYALKADEGGLEIGL